MPTAVPSELMDIETGAPLLNLQGEAFKTASYPLTSNTLITPSLVPTDKCPYGDTVNKQGSPSSGEKGRVYLGDPTILHTYTKLSAHINRDDPLTTKHYDTKLKLASK